MIDDEQLGRLFRDDAGRVVPRDGREAIMRRVRRRRQRRRVRRGGLAAAIVAALAVIAVLVSGGRGPSSEVVRVASPGAATVQSIQGGPIGLSGTARAVSCVSADWCVAVGTFNPTEGTGPVAPQVDAYRGVHQLYTGAGWHTMPAGDTANLPGSLSGVSCLSTDWCVAVGNSIPSAGPDQTLIETWNGKHWARIPSPSVAGNNYLSAVSCATRSFCVAVGYSTRPDGAINQTLAESFDGQQWTLRPPPNANARYDQLSAVSCPSTNWCLAVGDANHAGLGVDRYTNGRWSLLQAPAGSDIDCVTIRHCTATSTEIHQLITEQYLHGHWTAQRARARPHSYLAAIACHAQRCVAIGAAPHGLRGHRPLIEVLGAGTPTVATTSTGINAMNAISCPNSRTCIAVGVDHDSLHGIYLRITLGPS